MEEQEIQTLGALFSKPDARDYYITCALDESQFPEEFALETVSVKNQGPVGSCVAHALSEVVEYHHLSETKQVQKFSTGYIYGNRSIYKGSGMYVRDALKNVTHGGDVKNGLFDVNVEVPEAIDRYNNRDKSIDEQALPYRFSAYYRCNTNAEIKKAITEHGPVVFAMSWYTDIKVDKQTGIINTSADPKKEGGGHCMIIYGWCKDGWLIQNSWGSSWGKGGRAILPYNIPIREAWGVTDTINEGDIVRPYNSLIGQLVAKIINVFTLIKQSFRELFNKN